MSCTYIYNMLLHRTEVTWVATVLFMHTGVRLSWHYVTCEQLTVVFHVRQRTIVMQFSCILISFEDFGTLPNDGVGTASV